MNTYDKHGAYRWVLDGFGGVRVVLGGSRGSLGCFLLAVWELLTSFATDCHCNPRVFGFCFDMTRLIILTQMWESFEYENMTQNRYNAFSLLRDARQPQIGSGTLDGKRDVGDGMANLI